MPPFPPRIAALPVNERGFPVPFFVATVDGKPDFRIARPEAVLQCVTQQKCWICGQPMGNYKCFVVGPMCCANRTSAEPPSHRDCAEFAVQACPFMLRPKMVRREDDLTKMLQTEVNQPGIAISRNPGVMALWTTKRFHLFPDGKGGMLFNIGEPYGVTWWREGRRATLPEIEESIDTGVPELEKLVPPGNKEALEHLYFLIDKVKKLAASTA